MVNFLASLACSTTLWSLVNAQTNASQWPIHNDGLTNVIQWDHYSPMINGERMFLWSGEFHYWRIPVPEVWRDIMEKIKAAGFNTISLYSHWGFHAPNLSSLDFESGARNFTSIFTIAKEIGLYVVFRGGPYVNAESTAGGFALWLTTGAYGALRNDDPRYRDAWTPYMTRINEILAEHQLVNGGNVILEQLENETPSEFLRGGKLDTSLIDYMEELHNNSRGAGVQISHLMPLRQPLFTNAPNMNTRSWSKDYMNAPGVQDLYGLDSYPSCWSCNLEECVGSVGFNSIDYHDHFNLVSPTQPSFVPEFQGGSYNPWGGPQGGCLNNTGPTFVNTFYRHLLAERITMISLYMLYGGTNWGGLGANLIGTSYDYSAPISETRQIGDKYGETKLLGLFLRTAKDLRMTDRYDFSFNYTGSSTVGATELRNPSTHSAFYVLAHNDTTATSSASFHVAVCSHIRGNLSIPQFADPVRIDGQQSKVLVVDFTFGENMLVYSTAEVLSHSVVDGQSILALLLPTGESGEFRILGGSKKREVASGTGGSFHVVEGDLVVAYKQQPTQSVLEFDNFRVILMSRELGYRFWAPTLSNNPLIPDNQTLFVSGPYLVRSAVVDAAQVLVMGDLDGSTTLEVWAPASPKTVVWNGKVMKTVRTSYGTLKAELPGPALSASQLQKNATLGNWKFSEALPEIEVGYDDSGAAWVVADHMNTSNPTPPLTFPSLYSDDYGFHTGVQLFRGRFSDTNATGASITAQGGTAFGFSVYLNGKFLDAYGGNASVPSSTLNVSFADVTLGEENVLVVVMDHSGHDQRSDALLPRGILGASLLSSTPNSTFTKWTLAGNAGGESNIDPVRGVIAEGGLHAERVGWHLPGFDDASWEERSPEDGVGNATIGFFRTTVDLNVPRGHDASFAFVLGAPEGSILRAQLYVNGYQYGKFIPQIGNQITFPVPPGILDYRGTNTIGLSLWSQSTAGAKVEVKMEVLGAYESSWDPGFDSGYLRPGWSEGRMEYA